MDRAVDHRRGTVVGMRVPGVVRENARWLLLAAGTLAGLLVGLYLLHAASDARRVDRANVLLDQGRYAAAAQEVAGVHAAPAGAAALNIRAHALAGQGSLYAALQAYRRAAERAPSDWELRRDWAVLLLRVGQRRGARAQMNRALTLNPRLRIPAGFVQP